MPEQFTITDEMKRIEAESWKARLRNFRRTISREIRIGEEPKFINKDIAAPLQAFPCSDAADDVLDAAIEATETFEA